MPGLRAYLGRQAIFDAEARVQAYELLFRDSSENRARITDGNRAAAATMISALVELGLDAVAGSRPVFVNVTEDYATGALPLPLDPRRVVIEVLETVPASDGVLGGLRRYREQGFQIALDDFVVGDGRDALLEVADVVKIDVLDLDAVRPRLRADLDAIRRAGARPLAERIETREAFDELRGLGFELFQGYYLERPVVLQGRRVPRPSLESLRVLTSLCDPSTDLREVERTLAADPGMTYRLLRLASAATLNTGVVLASVGQAIQRLGTNRVAALAVVTLTAGFTDKPPVLLQVATIRGRMGELLAPRLGARAEHLLLAGLLSVFDALLDRPLAEVLTGLSLPLEVVRALLDPDSSEGAILAAIRCHERGDPMALARLGISDAAATAAWLDAVAWSESTLLTLRARTA